MSDLSTKIMITIQFILGSELKALERELHIKKCNDNLNHYILRGMII